MNKRVSSILTWLDSNGLAALSAFLLAFIPLYPKLPLFDIIPGYLVRVRIEDFAVVFALAVWAVQVWRKKITWKTPLTIPILLYAVAGLFSVISAVVITQTVPAQLLHIGKTSLHYFRYLEYFSLYFILVGAIKTRQHLKLVLGIITLTLIGITIYGIGQKYWYWPVYSTMNREFAKGIRLILTDHARVQSTFGGHYDLGGYLVLILPLLLSLIAVAKKQWRAIVIFAYLGGVWLMFVSASRTSLIAYLIGSVIVIIWQSLRQQTLKKRFSSVALATVLFLLTHAFFLRYFGDDLYQRVEQSINSFPVIAVPFNASVSFVDSQWKGLYSVSSRALDTIFKQSNSQSTSETLANAFKVEKPENSITMNEVLVASDTRPTPAQPVDVFTEVPIYTQIATTSAEGVTTYSTIETPRNYSENALTKGLSLAIRLDTLWPRALAGYYRNPPLGSGYATLTKESTAQFTEAESTDNNFLRTIGETGAVGFVTFYGIVCLAFLAALKIIRASTTNTLETSFAVGFIAATVGLLINASFIDVFAASKIAFYYWSLTGILYAIVLMPHHAVTAKTSTQHRKKKRR